ncbi:MAG TPA: hypothetical protein VFJ06_07235 [Halococcus sp.]|nr:hypothetical protein [Halococcus sp.]
MSESPSPYETDAIPPATDLWSIDPNTAVEEWKEKNDPLSPDELSTVASAFIRTVGSPAREETEEGVTEDDHLRVGDAGAFGEFAFEYDVVLVEPGTDGIDPEYGYLYGYTTDADSPEERGVPLLVCLPGPLSEAVSWIETFSETVADMPGLGIMRP